MAAYYHDFSNPNPYLSTDPDDAGVRYRLSGDLLLVYNTARGVQRDSRPNRQRERSEIVRFSASASSRMGRYLRESVADYKYMHTLTYPSTYSNDGAVVKEHLRRYLQELTRISIRNGRKRECSHFWFLEFQSRGAPHFHIFTTDFYSFRRCAYLWYTIVSSGDEKHLKAGIRVEKLRKGRKGAISYARKYATKQAQKIVPPEYVSVGRFWGIHGLKKRMAADTVFYADSCLDDALMSIKTQINTTIKSLCDLGAIKMIKRTFGFAMFHINQVDHVHYTLTPWIQDANALQLRDDELFIDAEITPVDQFTSCFDIYSGERLTGSAAYRYITGW